MANETAEQRARRVIDRCAGCGHCRELLDDAACLFMPELFRLADREEAGGEAASPEEMKHLIGLCNACGICPCAPVQTWIHEARDAFVARDGLPADARVLVDVQRLGQLGSAFPRLANTLTGDNALGRSLRRVIRIHPERRFPRFPRLSQDSFTAWARARGLHEKPRTSGRKVAYFAGCTARYFFPEVAKATVEVLLHNGISVYLPEQKCCGMPAMLEGDRSYTFTLAGFNVDELARCVGEGFDIVCSCPTCGYFLKTLLRDGAEYSEDYRALVGRLMAETGGDLAQVSERLTREDAAFTGRVTRRATHGRQPWLLGLVPRTIFADTGYFSAMDGLKRLRVSNHTYDLGEYLQGLLRAGELDLGRGAIEGEAAYFAPCHQRQQGIGQPWVELLGLIPEMEVQAIGDGFDCCGQSGLMGFKQDFHGTSLRIGARLLEKISAAAPERLVTDCLSCRIQFEQVMPVAVAHPVELLRASYRAFRKEAFGVGKATADCALPSELVEMPSSRRKPGSRRCSKNLDPGFRRDDEEIDAHEDSACV